MDLVGARFRLRRHDSADGFTKFRVVILMNNLSLLDGIQVRIDNDDPKDWVLIVCPIQFKRCAGKMLSIRFNLLRTLGVFAGRVAPVESLRARGEQLQRRKVAIVDGKVFHGSGRKNRRDVSLFGL